MKSLLSVKEEYREPVNATTTSKLDVARYLAANYRNGAIEDLRQRLLKFHGDLVNDSDLAITIC